MLSQNSNTSASFRTQLLRKWFTKQTEVTNGRDYISFMIQCFTHTSIYLGLILTSFYLLPITPNPFFKQKHTKQNQQIK